MLTSHWASIDENIDFDQFLTVYFSISRHHSETCEVPEHKSQWKNLHFFEIIFELLQVAPHGLIRCRIKIIIELGGTLVFDIKAVHKSAGA